MVLHAEDLPDEVLVKAGITPGTRRGSPRLGARLVTLGAIFVELKGSSVRDSLWVLRMAITMIERQADTERGIAKRVKDKVKP